MDGQNLGGLKWIAIAHKLEKRRPDFFSEFFFSVYIKMSFSQLENHFHLFCGLDFANERLLLCQFDFRTHN